MRQVREWREIRGPIGPDMELITWAPVGACTGAGLAARHSCSVTVGRLLPAAPAWGLRCLQLSLFETSMLIRSWGLPFLFCKYWTLNCETNSCFGINLVCRASNGWALKLSRVKMALTSPSRDSQTVFTFPWTIQRTKNCLTKEIMARKKEGDEKEIDSTR